MTQPEQQPVSAEDILFSETTLRLLVADNSEWKVKSIVGKLIMRIVRLCKFLSHDGPYFAILGELKLLRLSLDELETFYEDKVKALDMSRYEDYIRQYQKEEEQDDNSPL